MLYHQIQETITTKQSAKFQLLYKYHKLYDIRRKEAMREAEMMETHCRELQMSKTISPNEMHNIFNFSELEINRID